jgi:hypothetical protein
MQKYRKKKQQKCKKKFIHKTKNMQKYRKKKTTKMQKDSVYPTPTLKWHNVPNVPRNTIPEGCRK